MRNLIGYGIIALLLVVLAVEVGVILDLPHLRLDKLSKIALR